MKKLVALLLVVTFSCLLVGYAEQNSDGCSCLCCQRKEKTEIDGDQTENNPMTYSDWLDFAFPLVQNCYNLSTWVEAKNFRGFNNEAREWLYEDASFLLLDDIRCASTEQIDIIYRVGKERAGNDPRNIINTYKFIHRVPSVCEMLCTMHSVVNVPDEYIAIDELMMKVIEQIEDMRNNLVAYITDNRTMENWENNVPTLKDDIQKLELLFNFAE